MKRKVAVASLVALAVFGPGAATARAPKSIGIAEREFRISTYVWKVKRGPVKFNISNFGQDTHNVVVKGPKGYRANGPDVKPGERGTFSATLRRPGTYYLLCTRANHFKLGMRAKLTVRR
jgi:plastocyanin